MLISEMFSFFSRYDLGEMLKAVVEWKSDSRTLIYTIQIHDNYSGILL